MATLSVTAITKAGLNQKASLVAADAAGDQVPASSGIFVQVANDDASSHTVTITAPTSSVNCGNYGELPLADIVITIPASESRSFTIPAGYSNQGSFSWSYDAVTSVTVGVFSLA